ncbi:MAG TPA: caspase family protein [Anaerolineae bacterium]|nr:caspase family protein [Anaerolineae bacterium]HQM13798.1 caspase family protein [Anaerolineae bacterium]
MAIFDHGYALLIGVNAHSVPEWALPDVEKDVTALGEVLRHPERCAYPAANVRTLTGTAATHEGILDGLRWIRQRLQTDPEATAVIYYTGHGERDDSRTPAEFYLIPYDTTTDVQSSALRATEFAAAINAMQPQRLLVILDCCHAGGMDVKEVEPLPGGYVSAVMPPALLMGDDASVRFTPGAKGLEALAQGRGRAVLSASTGEQRSFIRKDRRMSIFTYHLIEALTGHAQPQEGAREVLVSDVISYVTRKVPESARGDWGQEQTPDFQMRGNNFPIALILGGKGVTTAEPSPALRRARRALAILEAQVAGYTTLSVPAHLQLELEEKRREVAELEAREGLPPTADIPPPPLNLAALRTRFQRLDAVEIETLCLDHFPAVYDKFGAGMRRDDMINLLLDYCRRNPKELARLEELLPR